MPVTTFNTTTPRNGGTPYRDSTTGETYTVVHDGVSSALNNSTGDLHHGKISNNPQISRFPLKWDTSSFGSGVEIISAVVKLYVNENALWGGAANDDVVIVNGSGITSNEANHENDYQTLLSATTSFGSLNTSVITGAPAHWETITLNATGLANINKTGFTKFGLRFGRDISATEPANGEQRRVSFYANVGADPSLCAILEVTYTFTPQIFIV